MSQPASADPAETWPAIERRRHSSETLHVEFYTGELRRLQDRCDDAEALTARTAWRVAF